MPTPEASASSSVALRNANITELAVEEADSFKANVSIMTQDQCLDNGHQANSNNRSSSDKVSDDLNNSKNSVVSNGVNSVQEFNVDVNREYSTDLVIVQNSTVDADSPPTGKVLPTSKQLTETPSDFVHSKDILDNSINNIDANKSECANNIVADMTVITHQNSSENMRDIIANSEKTNKNSSDSQLDRVGKSAKSNINLRNANNLAGTRRNRKLIRSENVNECEDDQVEDPIERLNKLRASISSALSEVKGVLKQYSTEQSCEDQNESAPSKQPPDDGPVRFRFVRKIRRRSVFSEDDETEIPKQSTDITASPIIENKVIEEVPNEFRVIQKTCPNENQDLTSQNKDENAVLPTVADIEKPIEKNTEETGKKLIETATTESLADIQVPQDTSDNNGSTTVGEIQKTTKEDSSIAEIEVPPSTSETPKIKNVKTKKVLKKDRRASIAAVEMNQISNDQPQIPLELKTQRRPSDSGTLVKQTTRIKASKSSEKPKLISHRKVKIGSSSKTESSTVKPNQTLKPVEVTAEEKSSSLIFDSTNASDIKTSDGVENENLTKPAISVASPVSVESNTLTNTSVPEKADLSSISPIITEANTSAGTSFPKLNTPEFVAAPIISSTVNADVPKTSPIVAEVNTPTRTSVDNLNISEVTSVPAVSSTVNVPQTSPKAAEVNTPGGTSVDKLNTPEVTAVPAVSSTVNTDVPQTSPKAAEVNTPGGTSARAASSVTADVPQTSPKVTEVNISAESSVVKLNTPEVTPALSAVSTKVKDDLPQSIPETAVTPVKPNTSEALPHSQQSPKTSTEATKVGIPNQQIIKSKQLSQGSKTGTPSKKSNTALASPAKIPVASQAIAKSLINQTKVLETKTVSALSIQTNKPTKMSTRAEQIDVSKAATVKTEKTVASKKSNESVNPNVAKQVPNHSTPGTSKVSAASSTQIDKKTSDAHETQADDNTSGVEPDVPIPTNVPKDALAVKLNLPGQESVEELQRLEEQQDKETSPPQTPEIPETTETTAAPPKKKRKAKRKVVIRRIKRKLSKEDTFFQPQETAAELEIEEKEIEEKDLDEEPEEEVPKQPKSCLKNRQFEIGDVVMYAEHYKKTQVRWKKAIVTERITSISYKLNIEGDERPAHISYIKKFTDRKVNFGGKEYLEIDYAQIEENEEKERNYSIWNLV